VQAATVGEPKRQTTDKADAAKPAAKAVKPRNASPSHSHH